MLIERKKTPQKVEKDWFYFSSSLLFGLCSDYISLRLLYHLEPLTTAWTILPKIVEVAEKSLKLYVTVNKKSNTALSDSRSEYGHNIEKLRAESASFNAVFDDPDIKKFTKDLCDKGGTLYQYLRYGSQETTEGITANIENLIPVIDKIFFKSIILLPEGERRLLNFTCILKSLVTESKFDQSKNRPLLLESLKSNNQYITEYIEFCIHLDEEHKKQLDSFKKQTG